ncbi:hypothetical protein ACLKA6_010327 [Drosophila palustris]
MEEQKREHRWPPATVCRPQHNQNFFLFPSRLRIEPNYDYFPIVITTKEEVEGWEKRTLDGFGVISSQLLHETFGKLGQPKAERSKRRANGQ